MPLRFLAAFVLLVVLPTPLLAQDTYAEGPVWDITFIRTRPNQRDAYLSSLKQNTVPILQEEKRQGLILDFKILNNLTQHDPQEWDVAVAVQYKNFAGMDGFEQKEQAIRDKLLGSRQKALQALEGNRVEMRDIVATKLIQEMIF